jgi:aspartate--ammonia ligase
MTEKYMPDKVLPPVENRDANSTHRLSRLDIQRASNEIKKFVEKRLEHDLNLVKHTTPVAFTMGTGINDDLDGSVSKRAVQFIVPNKDIPRGIKVDEAKLNEPGPYEMKAEVVQSLAKWKRVMLGRLGCKVGEGIYCDSTSIRKGYKVSSFFVNVRILHWCCCANGKSFHVYEG